MGIRIVTIIQNFGFVNETTNYIKKHDVYTKGNCMNLNNFIVVFSIILFAA